MTSGLLQELSGGEGQTLEFKESLSQCDRGLEALCGMVNADLAQGAVWFGVSDKGEPVGVEEGNLDSAQQKLSQKMRKFQPPIRPVIQVVQHSGTKLIRVSATRSRGVPFHEYDGRAFIREGSSTRILSLEEEQGLEASRDRDKWPGPWRCHKCGKVVGLLSSFVVTDQGMTKSYRCSCGGEFWPMK